MKKKKKKRIMEMGIVVKITKQSGKTIERSEDGRQRKTRVQKTSRVETTKAEKDKEEGQQRIEDNRPTEE